MDVNPDELGTLFLQIRTEPVLHKKAQILAIFLTNEEISEEKLIDTIIHEVGENNLPTRTGWKEVICIITQITGKTLNDLNITGKCLDKVEKFSKKFECLEKTNPVINQQWQEMLAEAGKKILTT